MEGGREARREEEERVRREWGRSDDPALALSNWIFFQPCEMTEMPSAGHRNNRRWHTEIWTIHCSSVEF